MLCVSQSSAFLLLPFTFFLHRTAEMPGWNGCGSSSTITLMSHVRPQKGHVISSGSHNLSGGQAWEPGFLASSQVVCPLQTTLILTSSLPYEETTCLSQKSVFPRNRKRGRVKVEEGEEEGKGEDRRGQKRREGKEKERFQPSFDFTGWEDPGL